MSSSAQSGADRDDATIDGGSSTDQHVTGRPETGSFITDQPPTGGTQAHGSSNKVFNEADGNSADRVDDATGEWDASKG